MPKAKVISPFYNNSINAPPPFPSMLTDQLELFSDSLPPSSLLTNEVLPPKRAESAPSQRPFIVKSGIAASSKSRQTPPVSSNLGHTARSPYPVVKARQCSRALSESPSELSSVTETSVSTSDDESTSSSIPEDSMVPKPPGEPGRPGWGGYNLEATLDWNHKAYSKFKVCELGIRDGDDTSFTHKLIDEHLDMTKCASAQDPAHLKLVREKVQ
ncbi:hypothetical protein JVT61DRAFT_7134 [Boletus reticuloceps]|uniref:Uncharacterized protein n=1 Tax=Boletus reticuloceps TaxID=495285 RepID=A0A8I3A7U0_9AGAM|nr:hypothetical protein JVT61DRAFT_7134 [Boletus reticuloceps]